MGKTKQHKKWDEAYAAGIGKPLKHRHEIDLDTSISREYVYRYYRTLLRAGFELTHVYKYPFHVMFTKDLNELEQIQISFYPQEQPYLFSVLRSCIVHRQITYTKVGDPTLIPLSWDTMELFERYDNDPLAINLIDHSKVKYWRNESNSNGGPTRNTAENK